MEQMMTTANGLCRAGKYQEGISVLKEMVEKAEDNEDRMFAAGMICSIYVRNILEDDPIPGTPEYADVKKYLTIAVNAYDQSDELAQQAFRKTNDITGLREILHTMGQRKPISDTKLTNVPSVEASSPKARLHQRLLKFGIGGAVVGGILGALVGVFFVGLLLGIIIGCAIVWNQWITYQNAKTNSD
jgi:hypothetical protein